MAIIAANGRRGAREDQPGVAGGTTRGLPVGGQCSGDAAREWPYNDLIDWAIGDDARVRRILFTGFALIGGLSTIAWVVTLATSKHHKSIWELLVVALACFLVAALIEVNSLQRDIRRREARDAFLTTLDEVSQSGRDLLMKLDSIDREAHDQFGDDYLGWCIYAKNRIAAHDPSFAHEFEAPEDPGKNWLTDHLEDRLDRLKDISRAVRTPGSHIVDPTPKPADGLAKRLHALR